MLTVVKIAALFGAAALGTVCTTVGIGCFLSTPTLEVGILSGICYHLTVPIIKTAWNYPLQ